MFIDASVDDFFSANKEGCVIVTDELETYFKDTRTEYRPGKIAHTWGLCPAVNCNMQMMN